MHITAKILEQLAKHKTVVPVEIYAQGKPRDPPSDALPKFLQAFTSHQRIGTLTKESYTGKLYDEWKKALSVSSKKPEMSDIAPSISSFMAVKDDEELVRPFRKIMTVSLIRFPESHSYLGQLDFDTTHSPCSAQA